MTNIIDNGPNPFVTNIEEDTLQNSNYRTTLWTGNNLQTTLMSIEVGSDIGLEMHDTHDQFLRVEQGVAKVSIGPNKDNLQTWEASDGYAIYVPAGSWHNLESVGSEALKLYSIYAPAEHPHGTVHVTREEADLAEAEEHNH